MLAQVNKNNMLFRQANVEGTRPVSDYFEDANARIESVVFSVGTTWGLAEFRAVALRNGAGCDSVYGHGDMDDILDAGGNDECYLGAGIGTEVIYE